MTCHTALIPSAQLARKRANWRVPIALIAGLLVWTQNTTVFAITITNLDTVGHTMTMKEIGNPGSEKTIVIGPEERMENICTKGCSVSLPNGQKLRLQGGEYVYLEDGFFSVSQ